MLIEDGDVLSFDAAGARFAGQRPSAACSSTARGRVKSTRCCAIAAILPRTVSWTVVAISKQTGAVEACRHHHPGFVMEDSQALLADGARVLIDVVAQASVEERTDHGLIKEKLRVELRRFFRKRSGRRPFVLPVIMEI